MNQDQHAEFPAPGDALPSSHPSPETLTLLKQRRSTPAISLSEPGPDESQIRDLIGIAARVPDHGKLAPWRFIIFEGAARTSFGNILAKIFAAKNSDASQEMIDFERTRFERAPVIIAVISNVLEKHKVPTWEQEMSAGAACQNMLIGASAMGFGAQWLSEWYAFDPDIKDMMGLRSGERIAGFIYIGTAPETIQERPRPQPHIGRWKA